MFRGAQELVDETAGRPRPVEKWVLAAEQAILPPEVRLVSREDPVHEAAKSLGVPVSTVRAARALFQEYSAVVAAPMAFDPKALGGGRFGQAQFELLVEVLSDIQPDRQRSAELREAFREADKDGTGTISFDQFATLLCRHSYSEALVVDRLEERGQNRALAKELDMTLDEVENLRLDYAKYDINDDGVVDREEFKLLLEDRLKVKLQDIPTTRVQHWWRCADVGMRGNISFEEFIRFHKRFFGTARCRAFPLEDYYRCGGITCIRSM